MLEVPARMAYWLVPAEPALSVLQKMVSDFAKRYDGPDFEPHATIYHGAFDTKDPITEILDRLGHFGELELNTKSLVFGDRYTQSCYIEFEISSALNEMNQIVRQMIHTPENHNDVLHMSLFYGSLAPEQRNEISNEVFLPKSLRFNLIKLIANRSRVISRADVEYWNERARRILANGL